MITNNVAASLQEQLDRWAQDRGFRSHTEMEFQLQTGKARLTAGEAKRALVDLKPIADDGAMAAAKAAVDATGLPTIQDINKSVARMVRILMFKLFGLTPYTDAERQFLEDRAFGVQFLDNVRENTVRARARILERTERVGGHDYTPVNVNRSMQP